MREDIGAVRSLPEQLKSRGGHTPTIGARVVVVDENLSSLGRIAEDLYNDGFSYANFTVVRDFEARGLSLTVSDARAQLESLKSHRLFSAGFAQITWPRNGQYTPATQCWSATLRLAAVVAPAGEVFLCLPDIGDPEMIIGSIHDAPLTEIWNSCRHQDVLARLNTRYATGGCRNCRFISCNPIIEPLIKASQLPHRELI
jgi:radical SAM protein with 4Fe4S-binding SPASM domain